MSDYENEDEAEYGEAGEGSEDSEGERGYSEEGSEESAGESGESQDGPESDDPAGESSESADGSEASEDTSGESSESEDGSEGDDTSGESGDSESDDTERDADGESGYSDESEGDDTERDADGEPGYSDESEGDDTERDADGESGYSDESEGDETERDADGESGGSDRAQAGPSARSGSPSPRQATPPASPRAAVSQPAASSSAGTGGATPVSVAALYADPAKRRRFVRWAHRGQNHGDVLFLYAVHAFRKQPTRERAMFIARMFLGGTAPLQVNLSVESAMGTHAAINHAVAGQAHAFDGLYAVVERDVRGNLFTDYARYTGKPEKLAPISVGNGENLLGAARKAGFQASDLGLDVPLVG